jgi:protein TonB
MNLARLPAMLAIVPIAVLAATPAHAQKPEPNDLASKPSTFQGRGVDFSGRGATVSRGPGRLGAYEMTVVDQVPQLLNRAEAARAMSRGYPPELRSAGVTGTVLLRFVVRADGTADPLSIAVESASNAAFVAPASEVVKQMRFQPAMLHGRPVRVWVALPVLFQLEEPTRPATAPPSARS